MNAQQTQTTMSQTTSQNIQNNQPINKKKKKKKSNRQKKQIELFEDYSELNKQAYNEAHEGSRQSLKIKLRNLKIQRTTAKKNYVFNYDFSGNIIQQESYRRAFIMNHLAKVKLGEAYGIEGTLPSIAEIMKESNKEKSKEDKSNEDNN